MRQYTPDNWPYDGVCSFTRENEQKSFKPALFYIVLNPKAAAKVQIGCFKARQMAYFGEQHMQSHT